MKIKTALSIAIASVITLSTTTFALANEVFSYESSATYTVPVSQVEAEHQRQIDAHMRTMPMTRSGEWRTVTVRQETRTAEFRRAGGQPMQGFVLPSSGGSLGWADGGVSTSFSIGGSWGPASVSASLGTTRSGVSTVTLNVPSHLLGRGVVMETQPRVQVTELRTEFRSAPSQPWQNWGTMHTAVVVQRNFRIVAAQ